MSARVTPYSRLTNSGSSPRNKDKTISTLIFDVIFFLFSIAVVKITFIFYCSVFLRANIDKKESTGCIESSGNGIIEFEKAFSPFNAYAYVSEDDGILRFWYYVSDITKLNGENQIELGSGGCPDIEEYNWPIGTLTNGWNLISKKFSDAGVTNGTPDLNALNWFRIYHYKSGTVTTRIDGIQIIKE